ncbi:MAG: hypothetical protein V5A72_00440, partial [Candidatus Nanohaloarchaea archaeon]
SLEGFQQFTDRTVREKMGPGEKKAAREEAKYGVEAARSTKWFDSQTDAWMETNPDLAATIRLSTGKTAEDRAKQAEAQRDLSEKLRNDIATATAEEVEIRDGDRGPGYYGSKTGFIRPLHDLVEPKNVLGKEKKPKTETSGYDSPEDVRKAYKNDDISKDKAKEILRKNWPDQYE